MVKSSGLKRRCPYCRSTTKYDREQFLDHYDKVHRKDPKVPEFWKKFRKPGKKKRR